MTAGVKNASLGNALVNLNTEISVAKATTMLKTTKLSVDFTP
jgi:hypothetical protein